MSGHTHGENQEQASNEGSNYHEKDLEAQKTMAEEAKRGNELTRKEICLLWVTVLFTGLTLGLSFWTLSQTNETNEIARKVADTQTQPWVFVEFSPESNLVWNLVTVSGETSVQHLSFNVLAEFRNYGNSPATGGVLYGKLIPHAQTAASFNFQPFVDSACSQAKEAVESGALVGKFFERTPDIPPGASPIPVPYPISIDKNDFVKHLIERQLSFVGCFRYMSVLGAEPKTHRFVRQLTWSEDGVCDAEPLNTQFEFGNKMNKEILCFRPIAVLQRDH